MIKILIGGSPCTYWSIAQKANRETKAEGLGWELFKNYLIAKQKFQPDFFLYENNKSAAQPIKDQIASELGVDLMYINSALVSAQNRQRFYAFNWHVEQPEDRGIHLSDILESGIAIREKAYTLDANYYKTLGRNVGFDTQAGRRKMVAEPIAINTTKDGKALALRATDDHIGQRDLVACAERFRRTGVAEPVGIGYRNRREDDGKLYRRFETSGEPKANALTTVQTDSMVAEPIRIGTIENDAKTKGHDSKQYRVYSPEGKATTLCGEGGGLGAKTGLYATPIAPGDCIPINTTGDEKSQTIKAQYGKNSAVNFVGYTSTYGVTGVAEATLEPTDEQEKDRPVYQVIDGEIEIKGKRYPIKLPDGYYIIRKLTPVECERLQTLPDNYTAAVSATQRYRGLGNGWTAEVIIHILTGALKDVPKDEEIVVLSMYDGIGTGRYCLDKMGFTNVTYYAYEIDKSAIKVAQSNYPDIIQLGDAFALRRDDWELGKRFDDETTEKEPEGQSEPGKEEEEIDDSESEKRPGEGEEPAGGASPADSEGSVRESSDPGGVRGVEEGEGEQGAPDPPGCRPEGGTFLDKFINLAADECLKTLIIRDFEAALKNSGVEPDRELIARLKAAPLSEVSKAATGFPAYIVTASLKNSTKTSKGENQ